MRNVLRIFVILTAMSTVFFGLSAREVLAAKSQMSQRILPVTFVYVGKNQAIVDTWSNVSKTDDLYVIKFFDASKKNELAPTEELMASFVDSKIYNKKEVVSETIQFRKENGIMNQVVTIT